MGSQRKLLSFLTTSLRTARWKGLSGTGPWKNKREPTLPARRRPSGSRARRPADEATPIRAAARPPFQPAFQRQSAELNQATQLPQSGLVQHQISRPNGETMPVLLAGRRPLERQLSIADRCARVEEPLGSTSVRQKSALRVSHQLDLLRSNAASAHHWLRLLSGVLHIPPRIRLTIEDDAGARPAR